MTLQTLSKVERAKRIIRKAEAALGPLHVGQKRDLLADNTQWSLDTIYKVVDLVDLMGGIRMSLDYPYFSQELHNHCRRYLHYLECEEATEFELGAATWNLLARGQIADAALLVKKMEAASRGN